MSITTRPRHYTRLKIEPIDYIQANNLNFNVGNIIKYVSRAEYKNGIEDLEKAKYYLQREIDRLALAKVDDDEENPF